MPTHKKYKRKHKYIFNPETLSFDKIRLTFKRTLLKFLSYLSVGIAFAFVIIILTWSFFDSPKEKQLKREIAQYSLQYNILNKRLDQLTKILQDIEDRDDNIYRVIFETEPIPASVRNAGFGGTDRYKELQGYDNSQIIIETTKKLDQLSKKIYVQSKSYDEIYKMAINKADMLASIPAIQPIFNNDLKRVSSGFGYRIHPIYKTSFFHTGIDFVAPVGTEVYATGNGVVEKTEFSNRGYGNCIIINHGYKYKTLYAHLNRIYVKEGQKVNRGQVIGSVGNTGLSVAPHLHYEVIKNNVKVDPINYFYNDLTPEQYEKIVELSSKANQTLD